MKRTLIVLVLIAALALGLAGCGQSEIVLKDGEGNTVTVQSVEEAKTELGLDLPQNVTITADHTKIDVDGGEAAARKLIDNAELLPEVKEIRLGSTEDTLDDLLALQEAFPEAEVTWSAEVNGVGYLNDTTAIDLSTMSDADVPAAVKGIAKLNRLEEIVLAGEGGLTTLSMENVKAIAEAAPQAKIRCRFDLFGQTADWTTTELRYTEAEIGNEGIETFRAALPYLDSLTLLRLESCGIDDNEAMQQLKLDFPDKGVVWSIYQWGFTFMTDSERMYVPYLKDDNVDGFCRYFNDVLYLDIGHNQNLTNIEFVKYFPKLTTAVLSLTHIQDISPLENCPDLEFLECFTTPVDDISCLAGLTKLEYLNLGNDWNLSDLSPIYGLDKLKIVRLCDKTFNHVSWAQVDELKAALPDCFVSTAGGHSANSGGWRFNPDLSYTERYALLRQQFMYDYSPDLEIIMSNSPSAIDGHG